MPSIWLVLYLLVQLKKANFEISPSADSAIALAAIKQLSKENDQPKAQIDELRKLGEALAKKKRSSFAAR